MVLEADLDGDGQVTEHCHHQLVLQSVNLAAKICFILDLKKTYFMHTINDISYVHCTLSVTFYKNHDLLIFMRSLHNFIIYPLQKRYIVVFLHQSLSKRVKSYEQPAFANGSNDIPEIQADLQYIVRCTTKYYKLFLKKQSLTAHNSENKFYKTAAQK